MSTKQFIKETFGGMPRVEDNNAPTETITRISKDVVGDARHVLSGIVGLGVSLPVRSLTYATRTATNVLFGGPWIAGHWLSKKAENLAGLDRKIRGS